MTFHILKTNAQTRAITPVYRIPILRVITILN